jgi:hypothetical protein
MRVSANSKMKMADEMQATPTSNERGAAASLRLNGFGRLMASGSYHSPMAKVKPAIKL